MPFQPTREISMEPSLVDQFLDVLVFWVSQNIPRDYELEFAPIGKTWNMLNFLFSADSIYFLPLLSQLSTTRQCLAIGPQTAQSGAPFSK